MTTPLIRLWTAAAVLAGISLFVGGANLSPEGASAAGAAAKDAPAPAAVEPDMHEFMEYAFEPAYKRLKAAMAEAPSNAAGWKPIKADSLVLAEAGNLLFFRVPQGATETPPEWLAHAVAVRDEGGKLYAAAKKREFPAARKHYESMIAKCNACHQEFAGGEHQLMP
ncbi:MAG: hypothetical protein KY476_13930 [Planctomycetes bacterium]|nr:hypothetical protein [Planctomycetota bacterium]